MKSRLAGFASAAPVAPAAGLADGCGFCACAPMPVTATIASAAITPDRATECMTEIVSERFAVGHRNRRGQIPAGEHFVGRRAIAGAVDAPWSANVAQLEAEI